MATRKSARWPSPPSPVEIKDRRTEAGLTQQAAADLVYVSLVTWQRYEGGVNAPIPAIWELFVMKTEPIIASRRPY